MVGSRRLLRVVPLLALASTSGCGLSGVNAPELSALEQEQAQAQATSASALPEDLAALRRATAPFHDFELARQAGYDTRITPCFSSPAGGMGYHYGKPALIDGAVSVTEPELLLYEPQSDGSLRLVAVEYIVPLSAWTGAEPPELFGEHFHRNDDFGIWALHAWVWRNNPNGLFADWNPRVTCAAASD